MPELSLNCSAKYEWPIASFDATGFTFAEIQYISERPNPIADTQSELNTFVNLRVGAERGNFAVFLFANNLTDERDGSFPTSIEAGALGSALQSQPQPRTFGVNLKINFEWLLGKLECDAFLCAAFTSLQIHSKLVQLHLLWLSYGAHILAQNEYRHCESVRRAVSEKQRLQTMT